MPLVDDACLLPRGRHRRFPQTLDRHGLARVPVHCQPHPPEGPAAERVPHVQVVVQRHPKRSGIKICDVFMKKVLSAVELAEVSSLIVVEVRGRVCLGAGRGGGGGSRRRSRVVMMMMLLGVKIG